MATATLETRAREHAQTEVMPPVSLVPVSPAEPMPGHAYCCQCGHQLRTFGGGRHRVYFELGDTTLTAPVMNRVCPGCDRVLPGKNAPSA